MDLIYVLDGYAAMVLGWHVARIHFGLDALYDDAVLIYYVDARRGADGHL